MPVFDTYHLKSMEGIFELGDSQVNFKPTEGGKVRLVLDDDDENKNEQLDNNPFFRVAYDKVIRCMGFTFDTDPFAKWVPAENSDDIL